MSFKYLLLDLDNTLYPKKSGMLQYIDQRIDQYIALKTDIPVSKIPETRKEFWLRYGTTMGGLMINYGIKPEEYIDFAFEVRVDEFIQFDQLLVDILGGVQLKTVVFSNSPYRYVNKVLEVLGIRPLIDKIYDIEFCDYLGKPNRSSYLKVLRDLKAEAEQCILVDDVLANITGAENVGITGILLSPEKPAEIEWQLTDIHDLERILNEVFEKRLSA